MNPVEPIRTSPTQQRFVLAKDQPEYTPLPVLIEQDTKVAYVPMPTLIDTSKPTFEMTSEWALTAEELAALVNGGRIRLTLLTLGQPFQPVRLEVVEP